MSNKPNTPNNLDTKALRQAFGSYMTGVTVVSARSQEAVPVGFTANSFTSVSLEPPLLLVCPAKNLQCLKAFTENEHFSISVLAETQQHISNIFSQPIEERFEKVNWHNDAWGIPIIDDAVSHFSCRTHQCIEAGDHIILLGEIMDFATQGGTGLGYANGGYFTQNLDVGTLKRIQQSQSLQIGAIIEYDGHILLEKTDQGQHQLPTIASTSLEQSSYDLQRHLQQLGLDSSILQMYSVFQNKIGQYSVFYRCKLLKEPQAGISPWGESIKLSDINPTSFGHPALCSMMERHQSESQTKDYKLYIGGEQSGKIYQ